MKSLILCIFILLISITISGCGVKYFTYHAGQLNTHISHALIIPIYIDNDFSAEHKNAIIAAAKEWNGVFNGQVILRVENEKFSGLDGGVNILKNKVMVTGEGWVIIGVNHDNELVEDMGNVLAFVKGAGGHSMVIVRDVIGTRDLKTIVMHEMGHLMGALHVDMANLMIPYYGKTQYECIDKITVAQVAFFMNLDFNTLNYCITPAFE